MKLNKEICLKALETMDYPSEEWDIIEQLINQYFDENGNVRAIANICFDEEKMKEICHEAIQNLTDSKQIKLKVIDKATGFIHEVGSDDHDVLLVKNGIVEYYNLQNGEGTGHDGSYDFVEKGLNDEL